MSGCIFCQIVSHQAPGKIVYQDDEITAFHDTRPAAPVHILIIPNRHIVSVNDLAPEDEPLVGRMFVIARTLAEQNGIQHSGYRLLVNTGPDSGQAVFHIHLHLMGGKRLGPLG